MSTIIKLFEKQFKINFKCLFESKNCFKNVTENLLLIINLSYPLKINLWTEPQKKLKISLATKKRKLFYNRILDEKYSRR